MWCPSFLRIVPSLWAKEMSVANERGGPRGPPLVALAKDQGLLDVVFFLVLILVFVVIEVVVFVIEVVEIILFLVELLLVLEVVILVKVVVFEIVIVEVVVLVLFVVLVFLVFFLVLVCGNDLAVVVVAEARVVQGHTQLGRCRQVNRGGVPVHHVPNALTVTKHQDVSFAF